jgi:hypothetical protein
LEKPAVQGQLGATLLDALQVSLAAGGTLTVLAASLAVWFRQPRRSSIRLEVTVSPGKTRLVLDAKNVKDAEALIRQAAGLTRTPPTGDDTDDSGQ